MNEEFKAKQKKLKEAILAMSRSESGRIVFEWMQQEFDNEAIFTAGHSDVTAFRLGQRDVWKQIESVITEKVNHE